MSEIADLLKTVQSELQKANDKMDARADAALAEARKTGDLVQETKNDVDKQATELNALKAAQESLLAAVGDVKQNIANLPVSHARKVIQSAGRILTESDQLSGVSSNMQGGQRINVDVSAALTSVDVAEGVVEPQRLPGIRELPKQRLFIRDLLSQGTTESPAIFWVQEKGFTNNAKPVPENTTKPYSNIEFESKITPVTTIAHMFKASKQILDDFKQLQSKVDIELRTGLKYVEEQQILFGTGGGANLEGIIPQATAFNAPFVVDKQNGIDVLRLAMLQAQLARAQASAHVLHFLDWAKIELIKDELGRYILGNPTGTLNPTLWGLPVVTTEEAQFMGKFLTGGFDTAAQIFDREQMNVVISTENADDFEKNMISIRCEERLGLAVYRPEAFIYGDFSIATPAVATTKAAK